MNDLPPGCHDDEFGDAPRSSCRDALERWEWDEGEAPFTPELLTLLFDRPTADQIAFVSTYDMATLYQDAHK